MDNDCEQEALIGKATRGDRVALERLLFVHYSTIAQHVAARLPAEFQGHLGVEDVLQETFIHVFRDISRFEPRRSGSFVAWVKSVAENRIRDLTKTVRRKKRGGDRRRTYGPATGQSSSIADLAQWLGADDPTPSRVAAGREACQIIEIALSALPGDYREAVWHRYFEGRSVEETSRLMGRTPGTIRGLLGRAKQKLRAALGRSSQYFSDG